MILPAGTYQSFVIFFSRQPFGFGIQEVKQKSEADKKLRFLLFFAYLRFVCVEYEVVDIAFYLEPIGKIGGDVMIAPLTFVNFDVPPHSIVIGNPAKIIHRENATEGYIENRV